MNFERLSLCLLILYVLSICSTNNTEPGCAACGNAAKTASLVNGNPNLPAIASAVKRGSP